MYVYLSPNKLSVLKDCRRCFFDEVFLKKKRPRGAYPTLPGAIDELSKQMCDDFRERGELPPGLSKHLDSVVLLDDQKAIERMRFWKEGLVTERQVTVEYSDGKAVTHTLKIQGAIDEILISSDDAFGIVDYKTKRAQPQPEEGKKYYTVHMNVYGLLLNEMGFPPMEEAVLWYMWPTSMYPQTDDPQETRLITEWDSTVQTLPVNIDAAEEMIKDVVDMIPQNGMLEKFIKEKRPNFTPGCEYCDYRRL